MQFLLVRTKFLLDWGLRLVVFGIDCGAQLNHNEQNRKLVIMNVDKSIVKPVPSKRSLLGQKVFFKTGDLLKEVLFT